MLTKKIDKVLTENLLKVLGTPPDASDIQVTVGMYTSTVTYCVPVARETIIQGEFPPKVTPPVPPVVEEEKDLDTDPDLFQYNKGPKRRAKKKTESED